MKGYCNANRGIYLFLYPNFGIMKTSILSTLLVVALACVEVKAQTTLSHANRQYEMMAYSKAIELYEQSLKDNLKDLSLIHICYQLVGTPTANDSSTLRINPDFDGLRDVNLLIAEQSRLAGGRTDSLFFTINVTTDGRLTPYQNRALGTALAGQNTVTDLSLIHI